MDAHRFDRLSSAFANRFSRRTAMQRGGLGLGAAALGAASLHHAASAQEATPAATPAPIAGEGDRTFFLFVQTFASGTLTAHPTEADLYTLTVTGGPDQTVYFSDRPDRIVGTLPTTQFLDGLGFAPDNPPNAALVARTDGGEEIVVVELLNPVYTERFEPDAIVTLTYDVRILADYQEDGLAHLAARRGDAAPPETFGTASLFIDDCADGTWGCYARSGGSLLTSPVGYVQSGQCWSWKFLQCASFFCENGTSPSSLCESKYGRGPNSPCGELGCLACDYFPGQPGTTCY